MRLPLLLPDRFTWGTDAGRVLTPADVGIDPDHGYDYSQRVPPKLLNYIHKLQGEISEAFFASILSQISVTSGSLPQYGIGAVRTSSGMWVAVCSSATYATGTAYTSFDGVAWTVAGSLTVGPYIARGQIIYNSTDGVICPTNDGKLNYSANDGASWSSVADHGSASDYTTITSRGNELFFMLSRATVLRIWATGISGGGVAPTTTSWGAATIRAIAGDGADNWVLIDSAGNCHLSSDAGDNWTQSGAGPVDAIGGACTIRDVDYCDGTVVAVGKIDSSGDGRICYSHDGGASWAISTCSPDFSSVSYSESESVRALGNNCWLASLRDHIAYSTDNGASWSLSNLGSLLSASFGPFLVCDGAQVLGIGGNQAIISTPRIG